MGISGHYPEAWAIALQLGVEACRSWWKPVEAMEVIGKPWKSSGSHGSHREAVEVIRKWVEDREGIRRGAGGSGEVQEVWKVWKRSRRSWKSAEEAGRHRK